jgi:acetyltransferase-like isoleucine patch superfamily enzyme
VLIGTNAIVLKGVSIGDNSVIGAGSVVTKSIPANCIAAGNPCRVIRELRPEELTGIEDDTRTESGPLSSAESIGLRDVQPL